MTKRARQAQKLNDLQGRIKANALVQEGTEPAEDANKLIDEYLTLSREHEKLVADIQETNTSTTVEYNNRVVTLQRLLQFRENLTRERNIYGMAAVAASPSRDAFRYMRSELKYVALVDVAALRREEEETNELIRRVDVAIQTANWETELA